MIKNLFEDIMTENFLTLMKEKTKKSKKGVLNKMNLKRPTPRDTIIQLAKTKDKRESQKQQENNS